MPIDLTKRGACMKTIRILIILTVLGIPTTPPTLAHDGMHDWKLSEILGWYYDIDRTKETFIYGHLESNTFTEFSSGPEARKIWRGRFEKLSRNQFVLISTELTNEKGNDLLKEGWLGFVRFEIPWQSDFSPGRRPDITLCFFLSLTEARTLGRSCSGSYYSPMSKPFQ